MLNATNQPAAGPWILLTQLGSGGNSTVFKARHRDSEEIVALKIFTLATTQEEEVCKAEARLFEGLKHSNIIKFICFEEKIELINLKNEPETISAISMEYASGGELFKVLEDLGSISETIVRTFFTQIISAVKYLHSNGIAHMDLKLENLLLTADDTLKLADFGSAIKVSSGEKCQGLTGTPKYLPPEALEGKAYVPFSADIFALGIMLFTLVIGSMPFGQAEQSDPFYGLIYSNNMTEFWQLHKDNAKESGKGWKAPSKDLKDLFYKLVHPDPIQRYNVKDILQHPWMTLGSVDAESLSMWMKTKKRILTRAKTAPPIQKKI